MRFIAVAGVIAVVFASANLPLASAHAAVDQTTDQCFTTPGGAVDITYAGPVGQSFRPTRARLTGVDIALQDFDVDSVNPTVRIQIREGTISGLVVGQTTSVVPDGINQEWWHIDFPTDVLVTPGNTYVIHVSLVGVGQNLVIFHTGPPDPYVDGSWIFQGSESPHVDLCFATYGKGKPHRR